MGAPAAVSVARASTSASATASASGTRARPVVAGLPAYMSVVDAGANAGAAQGKIEALQQQEQTDDRSVAEDLADRIGQTDARETMQAEDARQAARSATAQQGQQAAQDVAQAGSAAMSMSSQPDDLMSHADAGDGLVTASGTPVSSEDEQASRVDDGTQPGSDAGPDGGRAGGAAGGTPAGGGSQATSGGAAAAGPRDGTAGAAGPQAAAGTAGGGASGPLAADVPREAAPETPDTGAGALDTGDLVLIDIELAEHQRWAAAESVVGEAGSLQRAEFIAQTAGSGFTGGVASGAEMGLEIGLISRAVPQLGAIIGGSQALDGLLTRDWAATGATIGKFGEGSDIYDTLANTLASVSTIITIANNVLDYINGIVGVVEVVAIGVAAGAGVLAFFTFGATAAIAVEAGELAELCEEIRQGIGEITQVLNEINNEVLNPCILLFRALHEFTSAADPREIESEGHDLSGAASEIGGALGGWIGGQAAHIGAHPPPQEGEGTHQRPPHETPPAAEGDGPVVHFQEPPTPVTPVTPESATTTGAGGPAGPEGAFYGVTDTTARPGTVPQASSESSPVIAEPTAAAADLASAPHAASTEGTAGEPTSPAAPAAAAGGPQLDLPHVPLKPTRIRRPLTPDEIAPADTHSAYLRRLRAEAAGDTSGLQPGYEPFNIGRHLVPGESTSVNPRTPAPDLYQPNRPRGRPGTRGRRMESHHLEHQAYLNPRRRGPGIHGYDPREDATVLLPIRQHRQLRRAQRALEHPASAEQDTRRRLGTAGAIEQTTNLLRYRQLRAPRRTSARAIREDQRRLPPGVEGQLAIEHMGYLFSLSPISHVPEAVGSPAHEHPGRGRELARDTLFPPGLEGPHEAPVMDYDDIDWGNTFDETPTPAAADPPPATSTQTELGFETPGGPASDPLMPISDPASGPATRNRAPLTPEQRQQMEAAALRYGAAPESLLQTDTATGYEPGRDRVHLGPDAYPLPPEQRPVDGDNPANAQLGMEAAIAHEVIGHREAALGGATQPLPELEEAQASIRAGLLATDLPDGQNAALFDDAAARIPEEMRDDNLYMDVERYGPAAETASVASESADLEPRVIVDPSLYEPAMPTQQAPAAEEAAAPRAPTSATEPAIGGGPAAQAGGHLARGGAPGPETFSLSHHVATLFMPHLLGGESTGPSYAEQQAAHRAEFTDDNQPAAGVERINPHYSSPPGTPDQIVALQNEILNLLAVRARAEAESQHEGERIDACEDNRAPISQTLSHTHGGLGAVRAHEQAVARHDAANQAQQQRQQESAQLTGSYGERAAGMGVLDVPLAAWEGFTSLASHLPGSAGDRMSEMNAQARQMQDAFGQMGAHMLGADGEQPVRAASLGDDSARIDATSVQAQASHADLQTAADGAVGLQSANEQTLAAAQQRQQLADQRSQELQSAADDRQAAADSLADQMRAWAQTHHDERAQAIAQTVARLQGEGRIVTEAPSE